MNPRGIRRTEWRTCDRCGFLYPLDMLHRQQGLIVCIKTCTDDLSILYRQKQIDDILATPLEGIDEKAEKFQDPGELVEF